MRFSDVTTTEGHAIYNLGGVLGFNLFDGQTSIVFFGFFHEEEPREIVVRVKFLINNIDLAYNRMLQNTDTVTRETANTFLGRVTIEVLAPEKANIHAMYARINEFQQSIRNIPVRLHRPSEIEKAVKDEYEKIRL